MGLASQEKYRTSRNSTMRVSVLKPISVLGVTRMRCLSSIRPVS
jgi:hypothetical protein